MAAVLRSSALCSPSSLAPAGLRRTRGLRPTPSSYGPNYKRNGKESTLKVRGSSKEFARELISANLEGFGNQAEANEVGRLSFFSEGKEDWSGLKLYSVATPLIVSALAESPGYSEASYYTSLGLFLLSLPGVYSLIKRSVRSKIVQKTYVVPGPSAPNSQPLNQIAGEITSFLSRRNFQVTDRGETVTFEGFMIPSKSQASFLVFCSALTLLSVGLVLTIVLPEGGSNWYLLSLLSPLAGVYYWTKASRKEQIKVKMVVSDDEQSTDIIVQGDDSEIERLSRELKLMEKGMVYVKGIFEQ